MITFLSLLISYIASPICSSAIGSSALEGSSSRYNPALFLNIQRATARHIDAIRPELLAHLLIQSVLVSVNDVVQPHLFQNFVQILVACRFAKGDVIVHCILIVAVVLHTRGDAGAQTLYVIVTQVNSVYEYLPLVRVVQAHQQLKEGRLSSAVFADDGDDFFPPNVNDRLSNILRSVLG